MDVKKELEPFHKRWEVGEWEKMRLKSSEKIAVNRDEKKKKSKKITMYLVYYYFVVRDRVVSAGLVSLAVITRFHDASVVIIVIIITRLLVALHDDGITIEFSRPVFVKTEIISSNISVSIILLYVHIWTSSEVKRSIIIL